MTAEQSLVQHMSSYQKYVFLKEILYGALVLSWKLDKNKANLAKIYCNTCFFCMNSLDTYGYLVADSDPKKIEHIKRLWYTASVEEIIEYMCKVQNNMKLRCIKCMVYNGWHAQLLSYDKAQS